MKMLLSAFAGSVLCLAAGTGIASAQQGDRVYTIGLLQTGAPNWVPEPLEKWTGSLAAFRDTLRDRGFVLGKNLVVDQRHAQGDVTRLEAVARTFVTSKVDMILTVGTAPTVAAKQATRTIPIVFAGMGSPVEKGIVASLAKPGGNITGMATTVGSPKLWQLLREVAPATRRAGVLVYGPNTVAGQGVPDIRASYVSTFKADAAIVGIDMTYLSVDALAEIEPRFAELARLGDAAIYIFTDTTLFSWRTTIMELASRYRLPTVCSQWLDWGDAGCVMTYGEDPYALNRSVAGQVDKVLRGTSPADIPVEQPTTFRLIVNAKAARALDLTVPPSLLIVADQVIE